MPRAPALGIHVLELARVGHLPQDGFQQSALACPIGAYERRELAAVDMDVHMIEDSQPPHLHSEIFYPGAAQFRTVLT